MAVLPTPFKTLKASIIVFLFFSNFSTLFYVYKLENFQNFKFFDHILEVFFLQPNLRVDLAGIFSQELETMPQPTKA